MGDPNEGQALLNARGHLARRKAEVLWAERDLLPHVEGTDLRVRILLNQPETGRDPCGIGRPYRLPINRDLSRDLRRDHLRDETGKSSTQSRLPAPRRSGENDDFTARDCLGKTIDRGVRPIRILNAELLDLDHQFSKSHFGLNNRIMVSCGFEWVVSSTFGSHRTDARENSPRRTRRTRRMELDEPSNAAISCAVSPSSIAGSSASFSDSFVLFVSFVVKRLCTSVRVLAIGSFSLLIELKWQIA